MEMPWTALSPHGTSLPAAHPGWDCGDHPRGTDRASRWSLTLALPCHTCSVPESFPSGTRIYYSSDTRV